MVLQARLTITGQVQGVGYRHWAMTTGRRLGLTGWVRNRTDGSVEALIVGEDAAIGAMIDACRRGPAQSAHQGGGMRIAGFDAVIRRMISLLAVSPGTMAKCPPSSCFAPASVSNRSLLLRFPLSGPWHV